MMKQSKNISHKNLKNSFSLAAITLVACLIIASCATGSFIRTGRVLPPTSPEAVKVLTKHPKRYETLGLVEASTEEEFFESGSKSGNRALRELKNQAAKLGANAIILKNYGGDSASDLTIGASDDIGFISNSERKRISGEAIRTP